MNQASRPAGTKSLEGFNGGQQSPLSPTELDVLCTPGSAQPHQQGDVKSKPKPNPNSYSNPNPNPNPSPWALQAGWPHSLTRVQKQEHKWVRAELSAHLGAHGCRNPPPLLWG